MSEQTRDGAKPAIVLVHGAWADASRWNGVIKQLQADEYTVYAPSNPLPGLASDAATISAFLRSIPGRVILVGHSYGGAIISVASPSNTNVKALVYIDVVGDGDLVIPPPDQLMMAERARAQITHVNGSHPSMIQHPEATASAIAAAIEGTEAS